MKQITEQEAHIVWKFEDYILAARWDREERGRAFYTATLYFKGNIIGTMDECGIPPQITEPRDIMQKLCFWFSVRPEDTDQECWETISSGLVDKEFPDTLDGYGLSILTADGEPFYGEIYDKATEDTEILECI